MSELTTNRDFICPSDVHDPELTGVAIGSGGPMFKPGINDRVDDGPTNETEGIPRLEYRPYQTPEMYHPHDPIYLLLGFAMFIFAFGSMVISLMALAMASEKRKGEGKADEEAKTKAGPEKPFWLSDRFTNQRQN
jgi:hypothetical protein